MIEFSNGGRLVTSPSELPYIGVKQISELFADFETSSGYIDVASVNPWHDCYVAGIAITIDDDPHAYYVPTGHDFGVNLTLEVVIDWWFDILNKTSTWVNSGIKYDAHVSEICMGVKFDGPLIDTATLAKLIDSDRYRYGLKHLSKDWLGEDISKYEDALQPYLHKNKDYGRIPSDVCGEYACQDVLTARKLWKFIFENMPEISQDLMQIEIDCTSALMDIERRGLCVNPEELRRKELELLSDMLKIAEELQERIGFAFRADANADCYDVLCNHFGLPVLGWTENGEPSFDKHTLAAYLAHPFAPKDVVGAMLEYRQKATATNLFIKPWQELHVDGMLHSDYNQTVRTGRMSARKPNAQQLNALAKALIHPHPGYTYLSIDASQIEFRLIVHYINDFEAIRAYKKDPDTDFHTWVADMCRIPRKPAKNVNFCMGYGGGKAKVLGMLASNMELMASLKEQTNDEKHFRALCRARAESVYNTYHDTLPGLKRVSRAASNKVFLNGFVFNVYGRVRRLPKHVAHKAFNSLCQSSAADIMKDRLVALWKALQDTGIYLVACVHDEVLLEVPNELMCDELVQSVVAILETPKIIDKLRVPIRWSASWSNQNWSKAGESSIPVFWKPEEVRAPIEVVNDKQLTNT